MIFKPKIDFLYILPILILFIALITVSIAIADLTIIFSFSIFFLAIIMYFSKLKYEVTEDSLIIHNLLNSTDVKLSEIHSISVFKSILAVDSALSYKKYLLSYGEYGKLYIAPKDEHEFIKYLLSKNTKIECKL